MGNFFPWQTHTNIIPIQYAACLIKTFRKNECFKFHLAEFRFKVQTLSVSAGIHCAVFQGSQAYLQR